MFRYWHEVVFVIVGVFILILNYMFVVNILPFVVPILNVIGGLIAVVPPTLIFYSKYKVNKEIEEQFILFVRDLAESINTGMTLPMALNYCSKKEYFALSPYVNDLASQVDWGIPFEKALRIFAKKIQAVSIKRAVTTIIQTYKVGGKISDTLNAIIKSLITINRIKKERTVSVRTQLVTSYMIYFIFIFILVVLQTFLVPALETSAETPGLAAPVSVPSKEVYTSSFINFIIIQGFFAGLVTGKMSEGSIAAGLKHSILLIAIGYTIFSLAIQFQITLV